jgi:nicotinamidase-related amidase/5'-deoxynucleotidase YfbR-like HD superfamily hydrolase
MRRKSRSPESFITLEEDSGLASYVRAMALKRLYRQGWLKRGVPEQRSESVADHSFGTALLALLLAPESGPGRAFDRDRAALMALVHELGEVDAGDITPVDGISLEEKSRRERASVLRVLGGLPRGREILGLWEEFEEGKSDEARFVREIDRLEMGVEAASLHAEGHAGMEEFFESAGRSLRSERLRAALAQAIEASSRMAPKEPTWREAELGRRALLVIDVQNEYFEGGALPVTWPRDSFVKVKLAMDAATAASIPVVLVRHSSPQAGATSFVRGSRGWELHEEVASRPHDLVVDKTLPGSFTGTPLERELRSRGVGTVAIAGYMAQMCCDTTSRQALHLGFSVEFLSDATGTLDVSNDSGSVKAEELHRAILVTQAMRFAKVMSTEEWIAAIGG